MTYRFFGQTWIFSFNKRLKHHEACPQVDSVMIKFLNICKLHFATFECFFSKYDFMYNSQ